MVLFNDIVEVFTVADRDTFLYLSIHLCQTGVIGPTLINIHQTGYAKLPNGFFQKA